MLRFSLTILVTLFFVTCQLNTEVNGDIIDMFKGVLTGYAVKGNGVANRDRARKEAVITVADGILRGIKNRSKYYSFIGIRYGKAPSGDRRFRAAIPEPAWNGEKRATAYGPQCPQTPIMNGGQYTGEEDCLFLNVYLKDFPKPNETLPVMFYIHGGAFKGGSGDFLITGPEFLIQENVILVTINYRLGPLGYLSLDIEEAPGNAGLQDQILALKWVQRNIDGFGGDPDRVTIFGQSAGAVSTDALMISPAAKGLFSRVISQSGSILNPWAVISNPIQQAFRLGYAMGFKGNHTKDLIVFLKNATVRNIMEKANTIDAPYMERNMMNIYFAPVVEKTFTCKDCQTPVLTRHPLEIFKSGDYKIVPYIGGFTSGEGIILFRNKRVDTKAWPKFKDSNMYFLPANVQMKDMDKSTATTLANDISHLYIGGTSVNSNHGDHLVAVYTTDVQFMHGITEVLRYNVRHGNNQTFAYRFSFEGGMNFFKKYIGFKGKGASHGDELGYLFTAPRLFYFGVRLNRKNSPELIIKNRMVQMWTNFAKYGDPTPVGKTKINIVWQPIKSEKELLYLDIKQNMEMKTNLNADRVEFWDEFFEEYQRV
uniref:Carboxylic ester hydrolase n=1 Tax=Culicoides sonorensis TaxID=179676 RepID=A0A336K8D2_CULSO